MHFYAFSRAAEPAINLVSGLSTMTGPVISLLAYVLTALSLYTMAQRRGIHHAWLAWLPVADMWVLGSLSDQYRYVVKGEIKARRKVLLTLAIISAVLSIAVFCVGMVLAVAVFTAFMQNIGGDALVNRAIAPGIALAVLGVPLLGVSIAAMIIRFMALYDVFCSCDPQNSVLFLVLSILLGVTKPFLLFACREKEYGMPPRKAQYQPPVYNTDPPVYNPEPPVYHPAAAESEIPVYGDPEEQE